MLTQLILSFYKNYKGEYNDILLSYLIFPLTLHTPSCENIKGANSRSRLVKLTDDKDSIAGLPDRVAVYKDLTNLCLQYAIDNELIEIVDMRVKVKVCSSIQTSPDLKKSIKAASKLSILFGTLDVVSIYKLLGIKQL
ncbi:hypothetical protein KSZ12_23655 [Parabacteroides distasonis]|nr:hypothetical protein [Parabacteroides distasonis]